MNTDTSFVTRSREENWRPVLELAVEEVFEIMVGCRVAPATESEHAPNAEFTAMIGLAGALCGILTVCCDAETAGQIAKKMLGDAANSAEEVGDALGEICNMVAGNFDSGSAQMKSSSEAAFDRIAKMLRQRDCRLRIEGHTDSAPIHTARFSSNWELSTSRATEIVRLLIVRDGFAPGRLSAAGYAEYHPVASNLTAEGRGINRRVDIVILGHARPGPAPPGGADAQVGASVGTPVGAAAPAVVAPSTRIMGPVPTAPLKPAVVSGAGGAVAGASAGHLQH
ncbi:MAG: OmpA family protein [Terriglobales bacterium]